MTHPSDKALAQAFREAVRDWNTEAHWHFVHDGITRRAREMDAEKGGEELAEGEYAISSVKDLFAVPVELRDVCLRELAYGLALHELAYGERAAETLNRIVWRNDGKREYDLSDANGNQVLCMNITDATPPAQAAESVQVAYNSGETLSKLDAEAVERVARALASRDSWDKWDTARDFNDTPSGTDPEECRDGYRDMARAAIAAMQAGEAGGV